MVRLFRESAEEERLKDNLYALSMTMVILYHACAGAKIYLAGLPSILYLMCTGEDCMTVWVVMLGYHEYRKRMPGDGWGGKALHFGHQDAVILLFWILMRYIAPLLLMPCWVACAKSADQYCGSDDVYYGLTQQPTQLQTSYPYSLRPMYWVWQILDTPGLPIEWQRDKYGAPMAGPDIGGPWTLSWFMLWLLVAKVQAVALDRLKVHPVLQILITLGLGLVNSFDIFHPFLYIPGLYRVPVIGPIFGKGLFFCNVMWASYTATYIAAIHYAAPVVSTCMKLGKSKFNVCMAFAGYISLMMVTVYALDGGQPVWPGWKGLAIENHKTGTWVDVSAGNAWWALFFIQGNGAQANMFGQKNSSCDSGGWLCLIGNLFSKYGWQYLWTLFSWPVVVFCKMILFQSAPFHLQSIGTTTFGAYFIHIYCPILLTGAVYHFVGDGVGEDLRPYVLMALMMAYAFLIQYTVGRLANFVSMAGINWLKNKCGESLQRLHQLCYPEADEQEEACENEPLLVK